MKPFAHVCNLIALLFLFCCGISAQTDAVPNLLWTKPLDPPLHNEIFRARFSPDGRYLLTQDDAGLAVISRSTLTVLFRIDQPEILEPQFTPDSAGVVFRTRGLRIERWDIAIQKLVSSQDVTIPDGCWQTELSSDGKWLGCFDQNLSLSLIEVSSGKSVFKKTEFRERSYFADAKTIYAFEPFLSGLIQMQFSPNSRYFLAGTFYFDRLQAGQFARGTVIPRSVVIELSSQKPIPLNDNLKRAIAGGSAFIGETKLVGIGAGTESGGAYSFPEGKLLEKLDIPGDHVFPTTKGETVLLPTRNLRRYPKFREHDGRLNSTPGLCTFNVADHTTSKLPGQTCLDAFDGVIAAPGPNGSVGLYDLKGEPVKLVKLPDRRQTDLTWSKVTPDLKWVAVTNSASGGVWNLESGERVLYLPALQSGVFGETNHFYVNFPEKFPASRSIKRYDLNSRAVTEMPLPAKASWYYVDSVLVQLEELGTIKIGSVSFAQKIRIDVLDAATSAPLWSLGPVTANPLVWSTSKNGAMVIEVSLESDFAKDERRDDPALKRQYDSLKVRTGVRYLRIVESRTGRVLGKVLVEIKRGESWTKSVVAAGDHLVLTDSPNQIRIYSLATGKQTGLITGSDAYINAAGDLLAVQSSSGLLDFYDLEKNQKRGTSTFPAKVAMAQFTPDGKKLFVLTSGQTAYLVDTSAFVRP